MKIRRVSAYLLCSELQTPLRFSFGMKRERAAALVEIETSGGQVGWGEANWGGTKAGGRALLSLVEEKARPALLGRDPFESAEVWRALDDLAASGSRVSAAAAVDMALWDIQGQVWGRPIAALLGGSFRPRVAAYASGLMMVPLPELLKSARDLARQGWPGVKMRLGGDAAEDARRVRRVRGVLGPGVKLIADANGRYNRAEALRFARLVDDGTLEYLEEPLPKHDVEGLAWLAGLIQTPLAAGECTSLFHMKDLLSRRACQIIQPDVTVNGFTETRKILALAEAFSAEAVLHNFEAAVGLAGTLHAAASEPRLSQLQEVDVNPNPLREELLEEPLAARRGVYEVPAGPGLGVKVSRAAVKKFSVARI